MASQAKDIKVAVYGVSDIGLTRQNNEDAWKQLDDEQFYILADGMGGHQAGEIASYQCVEHLGDLFKSQYQTFAQLNIIKKLIAQCIIETNDYIYQLSKQYSRLKGMGTTVCCVLIHPAGMIYAHVGDSRIYHYRNKTLQQLTNDHSLLRELIDLGKLSEQQSDDFLYKNIITKAIGIEQRVEPAVNDCQVEPNDLVLMCTDGLTDLLTLDEIEQIILENSEEDICHQLVTAAKTKGGHDNITVVLIKIKEKDESNLSRL